MYSDCHYRCLTCGNATVTPDSDPGSSLNSRLYLKVPTRCNSH